MQTLRKCKIMTTIDLSKLEYEIQLCGKDWYPEDMFVELYPEILKAARAYLQAQSGGAAVHDSMTDNSASIEERAALPEGVQAPIDGMSPCVFKKFFDAMIEYFWEDRRFEMDLSDFTSMAERCGLIKPEDYHADIHGERFSDEWGMEEGDTIYVKTDAAKLDYNRSQEAQGGA